MLPLGGKGNKKDRKKTCHRCGETKTGPVVRCLACRKRYFCSKCIKKWSVDNINLFFFNKWLVSFALVINKRLCVEKQVLRDVESRNQIFMPSLPGLL